MNDHKSERAVMVVEDETLVRMFIADLLDEFGFSTVLAAANTRQAIEIAEASPPVAAVIDVTLGGEHDGIWLGEQLSARFGTKIIIMSGYDDIADDERIESLSPEAILHKPCQPDLLKKAIEDATS